MSRSGLRALVRVVLFGGALLIGTAPVAHAAPAPGQLSSDGCVASIGAPPECSGVSGATFGQGPGLGAPDSTAVSPDGVYVYVAANGSSTVAVLKRNARTGALSSDGCVADFGSSTCDAVSGSTHARARGLASTKDVAVSHDGRYVYALGFTDNTIAVLKRDPSTGALRSDGCLQNFGLTGCDTAGTTRGQARALAEPDSVAVSPDDAYVYVADHVDNAVAVLKRNRLTGALSSDGCIQETGATGCDTAGHTHGQASGLAGVTRLAVSPDGRYVYAGGSSTVAVLRRTPSGALVTDGCIGDSLQGTECVSASGTTHSLTPLLNDVEGLAVSPDNRYVYVAANGSSSVLVLKRDRATGGLSSDGCLQDYGLTGCDTAGTTHGRARALAGSGELAVSPDGAFIYVPSSTDSAVAVLRRDPSTGALSGDGCLQEPPHTGCDTAGTTHGQAPGLSGVDALAVSADARYVYGAASNSYALAVLVRYFPTPALSRLQIHPSSFLAAGSGPSVTAVIAAKQPVGSTVSYRLNVAAAVRFTVALLTTGRRAGNGRCVAVNHRNRLKRHCQRLVTLAGSFVLVGHMGTNSFKFSGRLHGHKLAPGKYRLIALPAAGGKVGSEISASFEILRKHK